MAERDESHEALEHPAARVDRGLRPTPPATDSFHRLTPETVLEAVEAAGFPTRPVCYPLNSFENRVYEVELADRRRLVAKFYRPGRWSAEQIREEHAFLSELDEEEIPVCEVLPFADGRTLGRIGGIFYSLWDRRGGRAIDELDDAGVERLGMFTGRLHAVAARSSFEHRPRLDADRYVRRQLDFLRREKLIPRPFEGRYLRAAEAIAEIADRQLEGLETHRLHGDLHLGNVLFRDGLLRVLDFDDACTGPAVQDLWLALPGRDPTTLRQREIFLEGYGRFRLFDRSSLGLVEVLRGLRLVRYCGWLARRREDPAFLRAWPDFGTEEYWRTETRDLEEQLAEIRRREPIDAPRYPVSSAAPTPALGQTEDPAELTNRDYFWDWEGD